jgi:hypothetical protein
VLAVGPIAALNACCMMLDDGWADFDLGLPNEVPISPKLIV